MPLVGSALLIFFVVSVVFIFILCLVPNVTYVSRLSILDFPFGFL